MHLRCFNELSKKCQLMQELCEFQEKSTQQQTRRILGIKNTPLLPHYTAEQVIYR